MFHDAHGRYPTFEELNLNPPISLFIDVPAGDKNRGRRSRRRIFQNSSRRRSSSASCPVWAIRDSQMGTPEP